MNYGSVTEDEARAVINMLPSDSMIRIYCNYASHQVSSNIACHIPCICTALGVCAPRGDIGLSANGFKYVTHANNYGLIVGASGDAEKTLAIRVIREVMALAAPSLIGYDPTAEETLTKGLAARPSQLFIYPDMGVFLSKTSGGDPRGAGLRDGFLTYFDGISMTREYSRGAPIVVSDPRPSFLGACTPQHLESYTDTIDWEGGLASRFMFTYAERERDLSNPTPDPVTFDWIVGRLAWHAVQLRTGVSLGMTEGAARRWVAWQREVMARHRDRSDDERVRGVIARTRLMAAKYTLLCAWSLGDYCMQPWWTTQDLIECGVGFAELHLKSALALVDRIAPNNAMREQRAVYHACGCDGAWAALGDVLRLAHVTKKAAGPYIETLKEQGKIEESVQNASCYYRQIPGGIARPYDPGMENLPPPPPMQPPPSPGVDPPPYLTSSPA